MSTSPRRRAIIGGQEEAGQVEDRNAVDLNHVEKALGCRPWLIRRIGRSPAFVNEKVYCDSLFLGEVENFLWG